MPALDQLIQVGFATLLGIVIGMERQWRSRMAGLQTMALVSMGSALFLILGAYAFKGSDPTRVAAQIVSGIGFLGAVLVVSCGADAEADVRALILQAITTPGLKLRSLLSTAGKPSDEIGLRAELSTDVRNDKAPEEVVATVSLRAEIRSARWSIRDEAAADWLGRDS